MRVRVKGIHAVTSKGRTYYYAWRGGGPRLRGEPGAPEFMASYYEAIARAKTPDDGTLHSLIAGFRSSTEFRHRAPRTRLDYTKHIKAIEAEFGNFPIAALSDPGARGEFKDWRDRLALKSPRQADYAWTVLARILSVAKDRGKITVNPCERGGRVYHADRNDKVWTDANEAAFIASAPHHLHLALKLALWTGQRQGDLIRLPWSAYDGQAIRLRQGKTRRRVTVPVGAPLKEALDEAARAKKGPLMLLTSDGTAWKSANSFGVAWRRAMLVAGLDGLTFHDLRGSSVTRLALSGATEPEIAAITGLSLRDVSAILDAHYLSRDVGLAESGIRKLELRKTAVKLATPTKA
jgi:integrase